MDANSMTFISYAQNFEDVMLMRALKGVKRGCYIDVGACAPDADSVTRLFYEQGWRGINVEPNPHYLSLLSEQRAGDKNLGIALSDAEGMQTFHVIGDTGLSSLSAEIAAA
jgi:FkbM family methyltransferase